MAEKRELWTPKSLYRFWNSRYFGGRLPDIPVQWSKSKHQGKNRRYLGSTWFDQETHRPTKITLNPLYRAQFVVWAGTLMHEMVHVQQWRTPSGQEHGRKFQRRIKQLVARGAYNNLL